MYESGFLIVIPSLFLTDFHKETFKFYECSISEWSARKIGRKHSAETTLPRLNTRLLQNRETLLIASTRYLIAIRSLSDNSR
jgi:hypothetical protein